MKFVAIGAFLRLLYQEYPTQTLFGVIFIISLYYYYDKKELKTNSQHSTRTSNDYSMTYSNIVAGKDLKIGDVIKMKGDYWAEIVLISKTTITVDDIGKKVTIPLRLEQKYIVS
ncbi:hypothetical protein MCETARE7_01203 [Candidatus Nanopelagicaceae bacterium]